MKDQHITEILDNAPPASLSEHDRETIRAHVSECTACRQAYEAAQLSELLLKDRTAEAIGPSPFFQTRVMAAWREQQEAGRMPVFGRLWKSAGALVSSLALTTAALAALSFTVPQATQTSSETNPAVESMVLDGAETEEQLTEEQMLSAMYVDDEGSR
jgi:predicted anti-sigma-YlaC factor YlaD